VEICGEGNLEKSRDYFEQAIEKGPGLCTRVGRPSGRLQLVGELGRCSASGGGSTCAGGRREGTRTRQQPGRSAHDSGRNEDELRMGLGGY